MTFTPCEQYHAYAAAGHAHFRAPARSAEFITDIFGYGMLRYQKTRPLRPCINYEG